MNIIEAIKSGKRFRHSLTGTSWFNPIKDPDTSLVLLKLDVNQLVSDDWEVEETPIQITESDFEAAVVRANQSFSIYNPPHICEYLTQLKKELGL